MPDKSVWQRITWKLMPATPVGRALVSATERLRDAGISTANLDAQVILAHVLGVERSWLFAHHDYELSELQAEVFADAIARRAMHEPVAYLVGRKEFYGLELLVDRRVLIPRPETELLVDAVIDHVAGREQDDPVRVADIGTGSAAIALAVAHNCPQTQVYAVDISVDALEVARANVARLDTRGQVDVVTGDLLDTLPAPVDVIVANLPYIKSFDYARLDPTVRHYEPQLALEAGPDGMDAIRRLLAQAPAHLRPGGVIVLEIAHDQGGLVIATAEELLPQAKQVELKLDYAGLERLVMILL
ncbi:MAG: peptide chain release factor N(5)-glutamine methyltransferase [Caldilineaceae bacterium]|nr:peptide chain release factor N(5)-glutamine methyltransferase [Caldilineaceae bacterium]MCB9158559.1 peptide chain release factor N(5)-glutamine methyltransferase [Caldilineaceae bacterium]